MSADPRVVVVGGGVAGLATAYLIRELGRAAGRSVNITVLEAASQAGGSTRTDHVEGYTCEWGPNGFLDNEPATLELVERLGLSARLVKADERSARRFIYHTGKMRELPLKPPAFLASNIVPFSAKLRIAMEFFIPAKRDGYDETVYAFGKRRLGRSFAELMLDPMVSGIFAGNTRELSLAAVFPKMVEMERDYGGLFKALIAKQKEAKRTGKTSGGPGGANATLHTFKEGMGEMTAALEQALQGMVQIGSPVSGIARQNGGFWIQSNGAALTADAVVLAAPSFASAEMIRQLSPETADAIGGIWHAPVDVVCHGYYPQDLNHPLEGFGVLVPRSEGVRSLGCLWCDSIFPGQAPKGRKLLRTIIGGAHDPNVLDLSSEEIEHVARRDHETLFGTTGAPHFQRVIRHTRGIAQYNVGHLSRVAAAETLENKLPGLFFTGASYRGVSVNGCCKDAFRVANLFWKQWGERA